MILKIHFILGNLAFMLALLYPHKLREIIINAKRTVIEWRETVLNKKSDPIPESKSDSNFNIKESSIDRLLILYISFVAITWLLISFNILIAFFLKIHLKLRKLYVKNN